MKIHSNRLPEFEATAKRLCDSKDRFSAVTARLQAMGLQPVPWFVIAVIAEREYGGPPDWSHQLAQGDPLNEVSKNEPRGQGPYLHHDGEVVGVNDPWTRAAIVALTDQEPNASKWTDWSPGGTLTLLAEFNGLGYDERGIPDPYLWAGTDQYVRGKYTSDGHFDPHAVDTQPGCAPIIACMAKLDPSVRFAGE